mmetsp:Transcript_61983/g.138107  ORF Transcript_61983/g.138107 Transcript_61983/m.138107 type:complete len:139 (-) Transcript_61983:712-1128(-)
MCSRAQLAVTSSAAPLTNGASSGRMAASAEQSCWAGVAAETSEPGTKIATGCASGGRHSVGEYAAGGTKLHPRPPPRALIPGDGAEPEFAGEHGVPDAADANTGAAAPSPTVLKGFMAFKSTFQTATTASLTDPATSC